MGDPLEIYMTTSFINDLSYQAPAAQVDGMTHTYVTGRKTWKNLTDKKEAVWPPHIEAALFDALEKYRPASSGDPRLLRRFPKRNRFISDHIAKITGKRRTPKQVGSRLQQLRDTCQEKRVLRLLSRRDYSPDATTVPLPDSDSSDSSSPPPYFLSSSTETSPNTSPTTPEFPESVHQSLSHNSHDENSSLIDVQEVSDRILNCSSSSTVFIEFVRSPSNIPVRSIINLSDIGVADFGPPIAGVSATQSFTRHLRVEASNPLPSIIPTVTFSTPSQLSSAYRSYYYVFFDGNIIHREPTELTLLFSSGFKIECQENPSFTYGTGFIPNYWAMMSKCNGDLSRYTVTQDVMVVPPSITGDATFQSTLLFTVAYSFKGFQEYPSDVKYHIPEVPGLGHGVPICARPMLLSDTSNVLHGVTLVNSNTHAWFDHGLDVPGPGSSVTGESEFQFVRWNDGTIDLNTYSSLVHPLEEDIQYLNPAYWS